MVGANTNIPRKSYTTQSTGNDNVVENGNGKSGIKSSFDTTTSGSNNKVLNGGNGKEPRGPNTSTTYNTKTSGFGARVRNGIKEASIFEKIMATTFIITVVTLLFGENKSLLSFIARLFILIVSILGLAIPRIPEHYWLKTPTTTSASLLDTAFKKRKKNRKKNQRPTR